jgi:HAMP domain-containing protein
LTALVTAWSHLRLATRLLLLFSGLSVLALASAGSLALVYLQGLRTDALQATSTLGGRATRDSAQALQLQATDSLLGLVEDQAVFGGSFFDRLEAEVSLAAQYTSALWATGADGRLQAGAAAEAASGQRGRAAWVIAPTADPAAAAKDLVRSFALEEVFALLDENDDSVDSIYLGTESGLLYLTPTNSVPDTGVYDPRIRPWYELAKGTDRPMWSDPYLDAGGAGLVLTVSRAARMPDGSLIGVVGADVTAEMLSQRVLSTRLGEQGYPFILDREGHVIAHPEITAKDTGWDQTFETDDLLLSDNPSMRRVAEEMVAGRSGTGIIGMREGDQIVAYAPVPNTSWSIGFAVPISQVTAPAQSTAVRIAEAIADTSGDMRRRIQLAEASFGIVFVVLVLLVLVGTALLSRTIVRPIQRVTEAAQALERGDLQDEQIAVLQQADSRDEVSTLSRVFARMAAEVRAREAQLRQQVEELRIEIDHTKKARQVAEITESDYFQQLQRQARALRAQREEAPAPVEAALDGGSDSQPQTT